MMMGIPLDFRKDFVHIFNIHSIGTHSSMATLYFLALEGREDILAWIG